METQYNLHQRPLMWGNQNDLRNQGFLFGNLEIQRTLELGVDESETTLHCYRYWKKSCYCNMQISSLYRFWDKQGPRSSCHSGEGKLMFVWANFRQCAVWNNWLAYLKNCYILSNTLEIFQFSPHFLLQILTSAWFVSTLNIL